LVYLGLKLQMLRGVQHNRNRALSCHSERSEESPQSLVLRSRRRTAEILRSAQDDCELVRDGGERAQQSTIINRQSSINRLS
jgi:hypothetical protein